MSVQRNINEETAAFLQLQLLLPTLQCFTSVSAVATILVSEMLAHPVDAIHAVAGHIPDAALVSFNFFVVLFNCRSTIAERDDNSAYRNSQQMSLRL